MEKEDVGGGRIININEVNLLLPGKKMTVDKEHFNKNVVGVENDLRVP